MIASKIPINSNLADVGCDHGYLIIEAKNNNLIDKVIAIDNKKAPLESAKNNIAKYLSLDAQKKVRYSLSSGMNDIDDDTNCIVIAGMGGLLINNIIQEGINNNKVNNTQTYVIEANRNCYEVRKFLEANFFTIVDEEIIFENEKYYEIIVCKKNDFITPLTEDEAMFGPILLKNKSKVFINKYLDEMQKLMNIYCGQENIKQKIERIKNICL